MSREKSNTADRCESYYGIQHNRVREWYSSGGLIRWNVKRKQLPVGSMPIFFRHSAQPSERVVFLRRSYKRECQEKTAHRKRDAEGYWVFIGTHRIIKNNQAVL